MSDKVYTLDEIRSIARPIARRYDIAALYLFGFCALGATRRVERGRFPITFLFHLCSNYDDR